MNVCFCIFLSFFFSAILACLLSDPLEKILSTLQLYLPLLSVKTTNDKLLDAYRDVLIYLDSKLENLSNISYNEQQLIQSCQHIRYFIENNPSLNKLLHVIPQLTALSTSSINSMHHQSGTDDVSKKDFIESFEKIDFRDRDQIESKSVKLEDIIL